MRETREPVPTRLKRDDPNSFSRGGAGITFEGQGMTLSAPGTEAFKQDFAQWEELSRQATQALDAAESSLSKKLQAKEAQIGWPPAPTTSRRPDTRSRWTATSRRSPREKGGR